MRADLVRHPGPPPLPDRQRLEPPAVELALPAIEGRAVDAHLPAGGRHVAQLVRQREQPQPKSGSSHRSVVNGGSIATPPARRWMRAIRGSGPWKPKLRWLISRTLELSPSRRAFERSSRIAARM